MFRHLHQTLPGGAAKVLKNVESILFKWCSVVGLMQTAQLVAADCNSNCLSCNRLNWVNPTATLLWLPVAAVNRWWCSPRHFLEPLYRLRVSKGKRPNERRWGDAEKGGSLTLPFTHQHRSCVRPLKEAQSRSPRPTFSSFLCCCWAWYKREKNVTAS